LFEETGIGVDSVKFGPEVWRCTFDLSFDGKLRTCNERFIVAKTRITAFDLSNMTAQEKSVIKTIRWFSLDDIKSCKEKIYPITLSQYLPSIISGNYPPKVIEILPLRRPEH
jgi:hypothetical protein